MAGFTAAHTTLTTDAAQASTAFMNSVVVVGLGQLGRLFAEALSASGVVVVPVLRGQQIAAAVGALAAPPDLVLLAVGERDLDDALAGVPAALKDRVGLLQNDLCLAEPQVPGAPTVAVVWIERKHAKAPRALAPTPIGGPHAALLVRALATIGLPAIVVDDTELATALVTKNVFIAVTNLAGFVPEWHCETTRALLDRPTVPRGPRRRSARRRDRTVATVL